METAPNGSSKAATNTRCEVGQDNYKSKDQQELNKASNDDSSSQTRSIHHEQGQNTDKFVYRCSECDIVLTYGIELFEHHKKYHQKESENEIQTPPLPSLPPTKQFKCTQCDRKYFTRKSLQCHQVLNCQKLSKLWNCQFCPNRYHFNHILDAHIIKAHPEEAENMFPDKIPCPGCSKTFMTKSLLNKHIGYSHKDLRVCIALRSGLYP